MLSEVGENLTSFTFSLRVVLEPGGVKGVNSKYKQQGITNT
jgi:hypothetical protein